MQSFMIGARSAATIAAALRYWRRNVLLREGCSPPELAALNVQLAGERPQPAYEVAMLIGEFTGEAEGDAFDVPDVALPPLSENDRVMIRDALDILQPDDDDDDERREELIAFFDGPGAPDPVRTAARALLDAFGGATPDWLRDEAAALESALGA